MQFRNLATDQFSKASQGEIRNKGIDGPDGNRDNAERCCSVFSVFLCSLFGKVRTMHPLFSQASGLTHDAIGAAIEVHKDKGPGLLESIYEWCLTMELELRGHLVQRQDSVIIRYKQFQREEPLRFDLLIDKCLLVEVKASDTIHPIHKAQLLSYMKLLDIPLPFIPIDGGSSTSTNSN